MKLKDRRILVTGAARGMGLEIALRAAARGARPVLWDVDAEGLREAAAAVERACRTRGREVIAEVVDVGDPEAVAAAARRLGAVDVLVNNAGVVSGKRLSALSAGEVERTLRVNAAALFWTVGAFLPAMIERGEGQVVTMASAGGLVGVPGLSDYCASKFAAVGFHEALRAELRASAPGVGTTLVCPFFVDTGMFAGVRTRFPFLLPILRPERVADAVVRAIERRRLVVTLPWFVHSLKLIRLLPAACLDPIAGFFGIHTAMDRFSGRLPPKRPSR